MRSIVGQPPRHTDFFLRPEIVAKIYRRLETSHVYLSAPRRVGKTAIMRHLEDCPKENFEFRYIITQALGDSESYYKYLLEETREFRSLAQASRDMIQGFFKNFKKFGAAGIQVEVQQESSSYFEECRKVFKKLNTDGKKLVLMIDEFSQTVDNIAKQKGLEEARLFLYGNRILQDDAAENIRFIYTGSLGLEPLCKKLGALDALNKLNTVEVGPLNSAEGMALCKEILDHANVPYTVEVLKHLLEGVQWLIPFHIQLVLQRLTDLYDETQQTCTLQMVDSVFAWITDRRSNLYFDQYHNHIEKAYKGDGKKYELIKALLKLLCEQEFVSRDGIESMAAQFGEAENVNAIIETLEYDGYIYGDSTRENTQYRFTSPIIRRWWSRNMS